MKKRLIYIVSFFFTVFLVFVCQKPLFMLYNAMAEKEAGFADVFQVMWHGASLDATMAGYFTALPLLLVMVSIWLEKFSLKKWIFPYYVIVALVIAVLFVMWAEGCCHLANRPDLQ